MCALARATWKIPSRVHDQSIRTNMIGVFLRSDESRVSRLSRGNRIVGRRILYLSRRGSSGAADGAYKLSVPYLHYAPLAYRFVPETILAHHQDMRLKQPVSTVDRAPAVPNSAMAADSTLLFAGWALGTSCEISALCLRCL